MRRFLAVAFLMLATRLLGQSQEKVDVAVTNLDVVVTDAAGKAVHGLTPADFEITEGKSRREITNLSEVTASPDAAPNAQPQPRSVLLFFDNNTLTLANRKTAAEAMKAWVARLRPSDAVAVATAIPSLQLKLPWTTDKAAITAAIDAAAGDSTSHGEEARRQTENQVQSVVHRAATASQSETVTFSEAVQAVRTYAESLKRDVLATSSSLTAALGYFPKRGRKNVLVIVGEGLPAQPGSDMFQYLNSVKMELETGGGMLKAGASQASPLTESTSFDVTPAIQKVASSATRSGVVIYAINPGLNENTSGQVQADGPRDTRSDFARAAAARSGYEMLVARTGGSAFFGMPPTMAVDAIARDLDSYYSVGYRTPASPDPDHLAVKTKPGYRVRFTRAAVPQPPEEMMKEAVLANHMTGPLSNDLKIALSADPAVADGEGRRIQLKVLIPADGLKFDRVGEEAVGAFSVYLSTGDGKGNATNVNRQTKELRWPAAALDQMKGKTIGFAVEVFIPQGLNQVSVGVMDERSQATGFERLTIGG